MKAHVEWIARILLAIALFTSLAACAAPQPVAPAATAAPAGNQPVAAAPTTASAAGAMPALPAGQQPPAGGMPGGSGASLDASAAKQKFTDIAYANQSASQKLDIYLPDGNGPFPVIVAIHGGGFAMGDKTAGDVQPMMSALARGYAVVSVGYRLSSEAVFPAAVEDVKAAVRFLRANAAQYKLNTDKMAAWGGSAGGNLAAMLGTSGDVKEFQNAQLGNTGQSDKVQAVVAWYPPINFLTMDDQFKASGINGQAHSTADSFESKYLGQLITQAPDLVKQADPETYITADDPPFFIQAGSADSSVPTQQSTDFAANLQKVLGKDKVSLEILQGANHLDPAFETAANLKKVLDWLDTVLK